MPASCGALAWLYGVVVDGSRDSPQDREPVFAMMSRLTIDRLGARGEGVAQGPEGLIYVPYALAGETIAAEVDGSRGTLVEVLAPSPSRIAPFCRYFSRVGTKGVPQKIRRPTARRTKGGGRHGAYRMPRVPERGK